VALTGTSSACRWVGSLPLLSVPDLVLLALPLRVLYDHCAVNQARVERISSDMDPRDEKLSHADEIDEKEIARGVTHVDDPVLEKKIVAHLDRRILPWIFLLWLLAFIDRSNVSECSRTGTACACTNNSRWAMPRSTAWSKTSTWTATSTILA